ncbi:MAG: OmpA family protein [Campylobacter sp.]|nr:OmpA family protein [Campylobacter sp.]
MYDFRINFDNDSDVIKSEFITNVQNLASYLVRSATIQSHTDNVGDSSYNKKLSQDLYGYMFA